jgi:hypothetical protein
MMYLTWLGAIPFILKRLKEEHAVLVGGLLAMRGDTPVRNQLRLLVTPAARICRRGYRILIDPVEAEHRICIADINR